MSHLSIKCRPCRGRGLCSGVTFQPILFRPYRVIFQSHRFLLAPSPQGDSPPHPPCTPYPRLQPLLSVFPLSPLPLEDWRLVWSSGQLPGKDQLPAPCHGQPKAPPICRDGDGGAGVTRLLGGLPSQLRHPPSCSCQHQQCQRQCCLWQQQP